MTSSTNTATLTLKSDTEVVMTRIFDAPRQLVFEAHINPKLVARWWGQRSTTTIVDKLEARPGGAWRFVQRGADGSEYGFRGEYREVTPHERLVYTFEFEPMPGHIVVDDITFEEHDGKTTLTTVSTFSSREDRDGMLSSGMEAGANESLARLDELLAELAQAAR